MTEEEIDKLWAPLDLLLAQFRPGSTLPPPRELIDRQLVSNDKGRGSGDSCWVYSAIGAQRVRYLIQTGKLAKLRPKEAAHGG